MPSRKELENILGDCWHTRGVEAIDLLQGGVTPVIDATTARTLTVADGGCAIEFSSGSAIAVTVPNDNAERFRDGSIVLLEATGAGTITVSGAAGVTIHSSGGLVASSGQYAVLALRKKRANIWTITGDRA